MKRSLDAFEEYVAARSSALLRRAVLIAGGDRELGARLLEDAFAETYRRWTRLPSAEACEPHTRSAMLRLALSRRHGKRYAPTAPPPAQRSDADWVRPYLRELTPGQRAVVVLRYFDDLTAAEAADALGSSITAVGDETANALAALQGWLRVRRGGQSVPAAPGEQEARLRRALAREVDDVSATVASVQSTVGHSDAAVHDGRRRRLWESTAGAAALVALAAWQLPTLTGGGEGELAPERLDTDTYAWAMSLPRGADAELAYTVGSTLVYGSRSVEVSGGHRLRLESAVKGGWLAQGSRPAGGGSRPAIGILRPSGVFQPFEIAPTGSSNSGAAVSPDRRQIAYGSHIFNASDGAVARRLPANVAHLDGWSEAGIAYRDSRLRRWLWRPDGGRPIRLRALPTTPPPQPYGMAAFSPGAEYEVRYRVPEIAVIDTLTGDALVRVPRPAAMAGEFGFGTCCRTFWEGDASLILELAPPAYARAAGAALLVRCNFPSGRCERASDLLPEYPFPTTISAEHQCGHRGVTPAVSRAGVREPV